MGGVIHDLAIQAGVGLGAVIHDLRNVVGVIHDLAIGAGLF
jgi:hypothetical protein